jgi:hypothetical protein
MSRRINNSQRRYKFVDKVFSLYSLATRPYVTCRRAGIVCLIFNESDFCEQCLRYNRFYDLAFPVYEWERLCRAKERLS